MRGNMGKNTVVVQNSCCSHRWHNILLFAGIIILGIVCRTVHLLGAHYYLLGTDSYYFASRSRDISNVAGEGSGLIYPVAYLPYAAYWLPVLIGVVLIGVCYRIGCHMYGKTTGWCAALIAAILPQSVYITAAGNIDRDGYCVVLVALAIWSWWRWRDNWKWVPISLLITAILVYTWAWPAMLIILASILLLWLVISRYERLPRVPIAIYIIVLGIVVVSAGILASERVDDLLNYLINPNGIAEMNRTDIFALILHYGFFLLPICYGAGLVLYYHDKPGIALLTWCVLFWVAGFYTQRVMVFAVPAVVVLAGYGFSVVIDGLQSLSSQPRLKQQFTAILCVITLGIVGMSVYQSSQIGSYRGVAAGDNWVKALNYLKTETPPDSVILSHWNYGKWIDCLAEREPLGGVHNMEWELLIENAYDNPVIIPALMEMSGADYFIAESDSVGSWDISYYYDHDGIVIYKKVD